MMMDTYYIHKTQLNFYCTSLFGERTLWTPDPDWVRPVIEVDDPAWMQPDDEPEAVAPKIKVADPDAVHPLVEVPNPDSKLPPADELIELADSEYQALSSAAATGRSLVIGEDGVPFVLPAVEPTADELEQILLRRIDTAADAARQAVAGDALRAVEYDRARIEAEQYAAADYQGAVPPMVAAWAINGRTAQEAANDILHEAAQYTAALIALRETRLAAKEQIRTLMGGDEVEQAQQLAEQTIAAIEAAVAGVGNAAA
ncbi:hypothetical protein [Stutzerimonas stutzeri]|uniref:Uncharacterized protein n=1 Tax=Stutzerimonas stutzeri TaxID=316 RepID=A0A6I6LLX1_STUST|nr:hypothetical protein [Stutzerimonas stutzeri]QGZ31488.1 hypothetical protein GQA94_15970 [Stutzerimonas stutzeri]